MRHLTFLPTLGDIGENPREIEFEPISEPGVAEPVVIPMPMPVPVPVGAPA